MIAADLFPITRTLEELKAEARADRNGYPLAGLVPSEVREALSNIHSLDRDEWAAAWSAIGDRYMERGRALRRLQRRADRLPASMAVLFVRAVARPDRRRKGTRLPPRPRRVSGGRSVARSALGDRPYPVRGEGDHRLPTPPQGREGTGPAHHRDRRTRQPQRGHDRAFQCVALPRDRLARSRHAGDR